MQGVFAEMQIVGRPISSIRRMVKGPYTQNIGLRPKWSVCGQLLCPLRAVKARHDRREGCERSCDGCRSAGNKEGAPWRRALPKAVSAAEAGKLVGAVYQ